jgi:hypothetical protein
MCLLDITVKATHWASLNTDSSEKTLGESASISAKDTLKFKMVSILPEPLFVKLLREPRNRFPA